MLTTEPNFQSGADIQAPKCTTILAQKTDYARRLTELVSDVKLRLKRSVEDLYHIGLNLIEAKDLLGHGKFVLWLKTELGIDRKVAERFINVCEMLSKCDIMSHLKIAELNIVPTVLYEIAAPSTPIEAREEVLNRALQGEKITVSDAKKIARQYKVIRRPDCPTQEQDEHNYCDFEPTEDSRLDTAGIATTVDVAAACNWITISEEHPHLAGQKCRVKYSVSRGHQMCELEDGSAVSLADSFLGGDEPPQLDADLNERQHERTFTESELRAEIARAVESALVNRKLELESVALSGVDEQLKTSRAIAVELREKNTQLQLEIDKLQSLQQLESENNRLCQEIEELKNALQRSATEQWDKNIFNNEAAKVLNREVAAQLEKFPPELNLRSLAQKPPDVELQPKVLELVGQLLGHLTQDGLLEYRQSLELASYWQDFEPIAQKWLPIKTVIWSALEQSERSRIKQLKCIEAKESILKISHTDYSPIPTPQSPLLNPHSSIPTHTTQAPNTFFTIGDRVIYRGSSYDAQSDCDGVVIGTVFNDFKIRWQRGDGSFFESRHASEEIERSQEVAA